MFIGMGSYDAFRRSKNETPRSIGFGQMEEKDEKEIFYEHISREDILSVGGTNELVGRFPYLVNYDKLSKESVLSIIDNIIMDIADSFNIFRLTIEDTLEEQLLAESNSKFGCRGLDSIIRTLTLKAYSKAITDKIQYDALVITLKDKDTYEYEWVEYKDIIPESRHEFLQMALKTLIKSKPEEDESPWYDGESYTEMNEDTCDTEMIDLSTIEYAYISRDTIKFYDKQIDKRRFYGT